MVTQLLIGLGTVYAGMMVLENLSLAESCLGN